MRVNRGQELVIAGYTPSANNFDAAGHRYYDGGTLIYAARTRNGFTPASRAELFKIKPLEIKECPFANLPEKKTGRWGAGLTAAKKMVECRWLKPVLAEQFEFVEWTEDAHQRHSRSIRLREDKRATDVGGVIPLRPPRASQTARSIETVLIGCGLPPLSEMCTSWWFFPECRPPNKERTRERMSNAETAGYA